jgi:nucleoid-associated protein YgaU
MADRPEENKAQPDAEHEQAANNLRQCVQHSEKDSARQSVKTDEVFQNGNRVATRVTSSGAEYEQFIELERTATGRQYLIDFSEGPKGEDPSVSKLQAVGGAEYDKVVAANPNADGLVLSRIDDFWFLEDARNEDNGEDPAVYRLKAVSSSEYDKALQAVAKIDFEGLPVCEITGAKPPNIEKESQAIADLFDYSKGDRKYSDAVVDGSERLSRDLKQLSGNIEDYNKLLKGVAEKIPDEPAANPLIDFGDFNQSTGTWDRVSVMAYDGLGNKTAYRIVQPGNTLSEIARDEKAAFPDMTTVEYTKYLQTLNSIENPDKIYVGQALRMRKDFFN